MLKMASATNSDHIGELCDAFKSFYNSKNHGAADIQLHQLMEDKGFRPCLEAKKFEYSNQVAYVLKCTVRRPVVFYLWRQRAKCRVAHLHTLPPANIAYLVSSREQEAVIAADWNRQSGSNGGGDGDGNGDGDSGKEDDEGHRRL